MSDDSSEWVGWGTAGGAIAIGLGGLLVTVRDRIGNTNVALVLVVVIVIAASLGGRRAGLMTAAVACLSFNFFHSQPHYTLRVHSDNDIWTIGLLFVIGLVVGEVSRFARHHQSRSIIEHKGVKHLEEVSAMVAEIGHRVRSGLRCTQHWLTNSDSLARHSRRVARHPHPFPNSIATVASTTRSCFGAARGWSFLVTASR